MKAKLFALSIFALFLLSVASALTLTPSSVDTLTRSDNSTSFTVSSDSLMNIATVFPYTLIIKDSNNRPVTLTITSASGLSGVSTATFNVILNSVDSDFDFGKYSSNLKIDAVSSTNSLVTASANIPIYFEQDFCRYGNVGGDLRLSIDFTDVKGYGSDTDWYLFDEVSGDIEVKNRGDDNIDNIIVRWGLYDKDTGEFIIDEEENDFDLDNGDSETINIKFTLDPEDFPADFNEKDFEFFVKVYSDDLGENVQCNSLKETGVKIVRDSDFVILKDIKLSTAPQCGESITVRATAWNIGENSEDDVYAIISSPKLGINSQEIKIGDLDSLEDKKISFSFDIP